MKYGNIIKKARMEKGIKQNFVAEKLGISTSAYYRIEAGETNITLDRADEIAHVLGMELVDLLRHKVSGTLNCKKSKRKGA